MKVKEIKTERLFQKSNLKMSSQIAIKKIYLAHLIHKRRNRRIRTEYVRNLFTNKEDLGGKKLVEDLKNDPLYHHRYFR